MSYGVVKLSDKASVKVDKDSDQHELVLEFDFAEVSDEQVHELLLAALKVRYAARARKLGEKALIDLAEMAKVEVKVASLFERAASAPADIFTTAAKITDEEKLKALIAQLESQLKK